MKSKFLKLFTVSLCVTPFLLTSVISEENGMEAISKAKSEKSKDVNEEKGGQKQPSSKGDRLVRQIAEISKQASQRSLPAQDVIAYFKRIIPEIIANNKDLRKGRCEVAQSMGAINNAHGEFLPKADIGFGYSASDSRSRADHWDANKVRTPHHDSAAGKSKKKAWGNELSLNLGYNLFNGGGSVAQVHYAENSVKAKYAQYKDQEGAILQKVFERIIDIVTQRIAVQQFEAGVAIFKALLQQSLDQMRVGAVSRSDVANAESNLAKYEAKMEEAKMRLDEAVSDFELWTGLSAKDIPLQHPDFSQYMPTGLQEMERLAEQNSNGLRSARYTTLAQKAALTKAKSGKAPTVDFTGSAGKSISYDAPYSCSWDGEDELHTFQGKTRNKGPNFKVGLRVAWNLDLNGSVRTSIGGARHDYVKAQVNEIQTRDQVISDVDTEYGRLQNAKAMVAAYNRQVNAEQVRLQCDLQELAVGAAVYIQVLKGQKDLLDAQTDRVYAQRLLATSQVRILKMTGRLNGKTFGIQTLDFNIDVPSSTAVELERMHPEFKEISEPRRKQKKEKVAKVVSVKANVPSKKNVIKKA